MSHDLGRPHDQSVIWRYGQEPIKVSDHPAKFGGQRHSGSGDVFEFVAWSCRDDATITLVLVSFESFQKMYLLAKLGGHSSYGNGDINSYINSYMNTLEKAELTTSIRHMERFLKSGISIYNSEVPDAAVRKTSRRRRSKASSRQTLCVSRKRKLFWTTSSALRSYELALSIRLIVYLYFLFSFFAWSCDWLNTKKLRSSFLKKILFCPKLFK